MEGMAKCHSWLERSVTGSGGTSHDVSTKLLLPQDWLIMAKQFWMRNWFPSDSQFDSSPSPDDQLLGTLEIGICFYH